MNTEVDREEGDDINPRVRHVIQMKNNWMKKPFPLDPIPNTIIFYAHTHLERGKGKKVAITTFVAQSSIRLEMIY